MCTWSPVPCKHRRPRVLRQLVPRRVQVEAARVGHPLQQPQEVVALLPARPRRDRALRQRQTPVRDDQLGINLPARPQAGADRAGAGRRVERKRPRLDLVDSQRMAVRARQHLRETRLAAGIAVRKVDEIQHHKAVREAQRRLDRVGHPLPARWPGRQPVDNHLDSVPLLPPQLGRLAQRVHSAVDPDPRETLGLQVGEQLGVLAPALPRDRREYVKPGALRQVQDAVDDLLRRLLRDRLAADRAVRLADARPEQAQVIVDLGDRADRRPRVPRRRLLVDRDCRRQALDGVDIGLVQLAEKLPCVGRQRFDITALPFGKDRVERQARLPRPGQPGKRDQGVAGQVEIDAPEIVLAGATDDQTVAHQ